MSVRPSHRDGDILNIRSNPIKFVPVKLLAIKVKGKFGCFGLKVVIITNLEQKQKSA